MVATAKVSEADSLRWGHPCVLQVAQCQGRECASQMQGCTTDGMISGTGEKCPGLLHRRPSLSSGLSGSEGPVR